eukprot:jgi/Mesvir1/17766/Mv19003-RA.1
MNFRELFVRVVVATIVHFFVHAVAVSRRPDLSNESPWIFVQFALSVAIAHVVLETTGVNKAFEETRRFSQHRRVGRRGGIGVGGAVFLFLILLFTAAVVTIMVKFRSAWAWIRGLASGIMAGVFKSVEMAKKILKKIGCGILAAMAANPIGAILYATLRKRCQNKEVPFLEFVKKSYELVQKQYENTRVEGKNLSPEAMAHNAKLEAFLSTYKKQWPKDFDTFKDKIYNYEYSYKTTDGETVKVKLATAAIIGFCDDMLDFGFTDKMLERLDRDKDGVIAANEKVDISDKTKLQKFLKEEYIYQVMTETPERWLEEDADNNPKKVVEWVSNPFRQADIMKKQEGLDVIFREIAKETN